MAASALLVRSRLRRVVEGLVLPRTPRVPRDAPMRAQEPEEAREWHPPTLHFVPLEPPSSSRVDGSELAVWHWRARSPRSSGARRLVVLCMGNGGVVDADAYGYMTALTGLRADVVAYDRPGAGRAAAGRRRQSSAVRAFVDDLPLALLAALRAANLLQGGVHVTVVGHSLGGCTAVRLAGLLAALGHPPRLLCLLAVPAELAAVHLGVPRDVAAAALLALGVPNASPRRDMALLSPRTRVAVLHSVDDELVPYWHAVDLDAAAGDRGCHVTSYTARGAHGHAGPLLEQLAFHLRLADSEW